MTGQVEGGARSCWLGCWLGHGGSVHDGSQRGDHMCKQEVRDAVWRSSSCSRACEEAMGRVSAAAHQEPSLRGRHTINMQERSAAVAHQKAAGRSSRLSTEMNRL